MNEKYPNCQTLSSVILADEKSNVCLEFAYYVMEAQGFQNE